MSSLIHAGRLLIRIASNADRRSFSASSKLAAAAEVKRLGVVGAGQMVGAIEYEAEDNFISID